MCTSVCADAGGRHRLSCSVAVHLIPLSQSLTGPGARLSSIRSQKFCFCPSKHWDHRRQGHTWLSTLVLGILAQLFMHAYLSHLPGRAFPKHCVFQIICLQWQLSLMCIFFVLLISYLLIVLWRWASITGPLYARQVFYCWATTQLFKFILHSVNFVFSCSPFFSLLCFLC